MRSGARHEEKSTVQPTDARVTCVWCVQARRNLRKSLQVMLVVKREPEVGGAGVEEGAEGEEA